MDPLDVLPEECGDVTDSRGPNHTMMALLFRRTSAWTSPAFNSVKTTLSTLESTALLYLALTHKPS